MLEGIMCYKRLCRQTSDIQVGMMFTQNSPSTITMMPQQRLVVMARGLCNIGYPSETHLKRKSRKNSFFHKIFSCWPIVLKYCTEHGSITAVLYANFKRLGDSKINYGKRDFRRFERFKMRLDGYTVLQCPRLSLLNTLCKQKSTSANIKIE